METKNKKEVVSYLIETHDFNSGVPEDNYWDEIEQSLDEVSKRVHDCLLSLKDQLTILKAITKNW